MFGSHEKLPFGIAQFSNVRSKAAYAKGLFGIQIVERKFNSFEIAPATRMVRHVKFKFHWQLSG